MLALVAAARLPMPAPLRNVRGAFILLAPFWLALHVVDTYYDLGFNRMQLLAPGNDWWQFQRFAYRIYMQGYWLEGGEVTFWFQPLYRWIAGALHLLFGQSQAGENYWDAVAILIIALFSLRSRSPAARFPVGPLLPERCRSRAYLSGPGHVVHRPRACRRSPQRHSSTCRRCACIAAREPRSPPLLVAAGRVRACSAYGHG